jgi:hypothetical protein
MKYVKRLVVSLTFGLSAGISIAILECFFRNSSTWYEDAFVAGSFFAMGCWFGIGIDFFHKDE